MTRVGVLALQGSSEPHCRSVAALGLTPVEVRQPKDLERLTHLVLPGGESTTLYHLLNLFGLWDLLIQRHEAGDLAFFGTCAGAILLGHGADDDPPPRLGFLDAVVERNAYGRQVDSFTTQLQLTGLDDAVLRGVFIRAPRIRTVGPGVTVLARNQGEPVLVGAPGLLAATFHPELTADPVLHRWFLEGTQVCATRPA